MHLGVVFLAIAASAAEPPRRELLRTKAGAEIGTLETAASTYFAEVAYVDAHGGSTRVVQTAREMLRDRDGLTEAESDEIIAVARRARSAENIERKSVKARAMEERTCADMKAARSSDQARQALEAKQAQAAAEEQLEGSSLLSDLTPATRTRMRAVLVKYRKSLTTSEPDWSRATSATFDRYKAKHCTSAAQ